MNIVVDFLLEYINLGKVESEIYFWLIVSGHPQPCPNLPKLAEARSG